MTTSPDDVFNRIMDNATSPNYNKDVPNGVNPDWYKSERQRQEEARQELEEWNAKCEQYKKEETPIERYSNKIRGYTPFYRKTLEEYKEDSQKNREYRSKRSEEFSKNLYLLHKKPDGMSIKEWKEKKRLIKLERKQELKDYDLGFKSSPNWIVENNIRKITCDCTGEGIRNGITCDICKLLVKVNDYMMNLFKDAAEGRSSIV